ncbi:MAG TPA: hypothetical protein VG815_18835, partial [Chloroflexota bacterium]|nr:hypothetical protein [Chloroflexota bacterium]
MRHFWLKALFKMIFRSLGRKRPRVRRNYIAFRRFSVEPLEERLAPSVTHTLSPSGSIASFTGNAADTLYLSVDNNGALDYSTDSINYTNNLGNGATLTIGSGDSVQVNLLGANSKLVIDSSLSNLLQTTGATLNFTGGTGADLVGPVGDIIWNITGANSGTLDSDISFSNVANLTSGASSVTGAVNDYIFSPGGSLSGMIQGQPATNPENSDTISVLLPTTANAQTFTLVPGATSTAGSVQENGTTIVTYAGIKQPVNLTVVTPTAPEQIEMTGNATAGTAAITSTSTTPAFGTVTASFNAGTVVGLDAGPSSNSLKLDSSVETAILQGNGQIAIDNATELWNNASSGTFTISASVNGTTATTGSINQNASAAAVEAALNNLAGVQAIVTGSGTLANPWVIYGTGFATLSTDDTLLSGGSSTLEDGTGSNNGNTLTSNAAQNAWDITAQNQGTLNSNVSFTNVQNLLGSPGDTSDDFTFSDQASVSGMVAGGGGTDTTTLDYSKYTSNVAVNFGTGAATGTGSAINFNTLIGAAGTNSAGVAATTTLSGPTAESVWDVTGADAGTLALTNDVTQLWNNASGGTFTITAPVNGGASQTTASSLNWNATAAQVQAALNKLTGVSVTVTGVGTSANPWVIVGTSDVTLSTNDSLTGGSSTVQVVPNTTVLNFSGVDNLTGAATNRDAFTIEQAGSISGSITGVATANDGLIVQDANDDNYTVVNAQTGSNNQITVNGQTITYSNLNPFVQNGTTTIDGGEVDSQWSLAGDLGVENITVTEGGSGYTSAPDVVFTGGGGSGAAGTAVLTNGVVTSVTITDPGSGYTSAPYVSFTGGGGTGAMATASITPSGQMTITNLNGNFYDAASQQYVTYLNFTAPTAPLTVALGDGSSSITLDAVTGVPEVNIQGGAGNNTLIGSQNASHTWGITGVNSGSVSGYGATTVTFSNVGTLVGGDQNDTFDYAPGASENGVDGGGGTDTLDGGTAVYKASASAPNTPNSIVFASSDGLVQGEQVIYVSNLAAGADTSGLTLNKIYYVKVINPTTIQLSLGSGGSPVSLGTSPWAAGTNWLEPSKTLNYSAVSNADVTLGTGNVDINNVIGGTGTDNTLVGVADNNVWTISVQNSGTVVTTRHDTTTLDAITVVNTATGTPSGSTPNTIVFPVTDGFYQGEQVTYVRTVSTLKTTANGTQLWNNAGGGVFTITATVNGKAETTGNIAWNADALDVQSALNSLNGVNVSVSGSGTTANPWLIKGLSGVTLTTNDSLLTPSSGTGTKDASGLTPNATYYVNVIDSYTIQLGLTPPSGTTFTPVPLNGDPWA